MQLVGRFLLGFIVGLRSNIHRPWSQFFFRESDRDTPPSKYKGLMVVVFQKNMALETRSQRYVKQYVFVMRVILKSMDMCRNYSITFKIFLKSNLSRKQKVLHFFDNTFIFHSHFVCLKQIKRCFLIRNITLLRTS